jgi:octaprenyl-diphosphate synthase
MRDNRTISAVSRQRNIVTAALARTYCDIGLDPATASILAGNGRANRGIIVYSIGSSSANDEHVLALASGVEMMHRASVIIDDIEDGDVVRRSTPCLHVSIGISRALAIADLLLSEAMHLFLTVGSPYLLEALSTYAEMARGQALDVRAIARENIAIDESAMLKTGSLVRMCFRFGARISGCTEDIITLYGGIGMHLGSAFQLQNDINDYAGDDPRHTELNSDIARGNLSSIVLASSEIPSGRNQGESALARVLKCRDDHLSSLQAILHSDQIGMPQSLLLLIRGFSTAAEIVADQSSEGP